MPAERVQRRLAAVVAVDVVGFSRLMEADEAGTLAALKDHRAATEPISAKYGARLVGTAGDGQIWEFPSVVDAVTCSVEVQEAVAARNEGVPEDRRVAFRVGINLGDVIIDGEDIYGDGVNVAARLEGLAEPGGICVSGDVYRQVEGKTDLAFEDMGEQKVKNIKRPVRVYRVRMEGEDDGTGSTAARQTPALELPDKPSIAVLAFENMSGDPEQEYFSDGIAEDIITALSKFRWFFVIARNSSFTYKGKSVDVRQVGRELGVRYVLEGGVRKAGSRVRVTAQLIDASTGNHIWAERYDREIEHIFALQDEITSAITGAIGLELAGAEQERATRKTPKNLGAWDLYQRGMWHLWRWGDDDADRAHELLRQAIAMDPGLASAQAGLAYLMYLFVQFGRTDSPGETMAEALQVAEKAVAIDEKDAYAHYALGRIHTMRGDAHAAKGEIERALELNPNFAQSSYALGYLLLLLNSEAEAIQHFDRALRLSPNDPLGWGYEFMKAFALQTLGRFDEAEDMFDKVCRYPTSQFWPYAGKAGLLAALDRMDEARAALRVALDRRPELTLTVIDKSIPPMRCAFRSELLDNLRKAGLPE